MVLPVEAETVKETEAAAAAAVTEMETAAVEMEVEAEAVEMEVETAGMEVETAGMEVETAATAMRPIRPQFPVRR